MAGKKMQRVKAVKVKSGLGASRSTTSGISKADKVRYVKKQGQTRDHKCHWPGCKQQVPPAMWGCRTHWFKLPPVVRKRIWAAYRPGQEKDMRPSVEYIHAARDAQEWIRQHLDEEKE